MAILVWENILHAFKNMTLQIIYFGLCNVRNAIMKKNLINEALVKTDENIFQKWAWILIGIIGNISPVSCSND